MIDLGLLALLALGLMIGFSIILGGEDEGK